MNKKIEQMTGARPVAKEIRGVSSPPSNLRDLISLITDCYDELSPQFQQIAHYVKSNPDEVALAPIRVLAAHIGAHPSTIVRFAKSLNYRGFKEMQQIFKFEVYSHSGGENSRIVALKQQLAGQERGAAWDYASGLIASEVNSLSALLEELDYTQVEQFVALLNHARAVWILSEYDGQIAALHLDTLLAQLGLDVRRIPYTAQQASKLLGFVRSDDVIIALEFEDHSATLDALLKQVDRSGAKIVSIITKGLSRRKSILSFALPAPDTDLAAALCAPLVFAHLVAALLAHRRDPLQHKPRDYGDFDPRGW